MTKNKIIFNYIHFSYNNFTKENFRSEIINKFKLNTTYSIFIKISSQNNLIFKMCGPQIGLIIKNEHDLDFYNKLFSVIQIRIESTVDLYNYIENIDAIEIMYSIITPSTELAIKNISNLSLNKQLINVKEVKKNFNQNILPFTMDTTYYGVPVYSYSEERSKYIELINSNMNLNKKINKFIINDSDKLFIYESPNNNKFIIVSKLITENEFLRIIFDFETGIFIKEMKDRLIYSNNNLFFNRTIDSFTLTIKENKIISYKIENKITPIRSEIKPLRDRNIKFGTFDLESFKDEQNLAKVYALGFITTVDSYPKLYYLTDYNNLDSQNLILKCIDDMLINKYNNFIFYTHNLGKYDVVFLYNALLKANSDKGYNYYILNTTMRESTIIRLDIKIKMKSNKSINKENKTRFIKISFFDSLNLLNYSLEKLTTDFNLEIKKGKFPHSFVNKNNLNYIGKKPDISYYDSISITEYQHISDTNWNLKLESLSYLHNDIKSLFNILNEFSRFLYINFNIQMTDALTITRLALNIFKSKFYKNKFIPSINKLFLFNFIKEGYYGGITEVYKPYGKDLVFLDINSLYPYVALSDMPGLECTYIESLEENGLELDNLFGFFFAKVKTNNLYLGLLPIHTKEQLISPNGEFCGIWYSEELKLAKSKGYDITIIKGYQFNKVKNIFNDYVNELFELKKNSTGSNKMIFKSLLNNLLGRFGLNLIKPITQIVNLEKRDFIVSTRSVKSHIILNENKILITYNPTISQQICEEHGLDYIKVLENESKMNIEKNLDVFKDVSIAITAAITSYARIYMNKFKLEILEKGSSIYYSDTDSLVIQKKDLNPNWIGKELGLFKLEYEIKEAYFISNKTYCLILTNGNTVIKTKGVINNSIKVEDFISMYWNKLNISATKFNTKTNYQKGSVLIEKKDVILNFDSYTKREKIFNNKGIWIETKPLNIKL